MAENTSFTGGNSGEEFTKRESIRRLSGDGSWEGRFASASSDLEIGKKETHLKVEMIVIFTAHQDFYNSNFELFEECQIDSECDSFFKNM